MRGARGVTLTEAGRQLAPAVSDGFARLRAAFDELRGSDEGVLSITVLNAFATNWLVPRLGEFQLANPQIAVKLDVSSHLVDFVRDNIDLGIRSGRGDWPGLIAHRLFPVAFTPMLSPRLLERSWGIQSPADLLKLPLIDPLDAWWGEWFVAAGLEAPDLSHRTEMRVSFQNLAGTAALAGQGVAMLTPAFFAGEIAAGRLIQPFPLVYQPGSLYWLVYPEGRRRSPKIRAFREWLLDAIERA